jgi:hypothetical protein
MEGPHAENSALDAFELGCLLAGLTFWDSTSGCERILPVPMAPERSLSGRNRSVTALNRSSKSIIV